MLKYLPACLTAALLLLGVQGQAAAEKRVALVIGNSAYQHTPALKNPSNDASDMAAALRQLDFEVIDGTDLTRMRWSSASGSSPPSWPEPTSVFSSM